MKKTALWVCFTLLAMPGFPQSLQVEPPFWWAGMNSTGLQLLVEGEGVENCSVSLADPSGAGVSVVSFQPGNPGYLFIDLAFEQTLRPGTIELLFTAKGRRTRTLAYELRRREPGSAGRTGFGPQDVFYLLMPDRFANGDPSNDQVPGMLERCDRYNPDGRHGGDMAGIRKNLGYLHDMGFTALWINPLLENDMPNYSYHGYAITDFYRIDRRFGTNRDYLDLVEEAHNLGIKVVMDMVFNHFGTSHRWMGRLPDADWVNQWPIFTRTNYRAGVITDPYASGYDVKRMADGWFDLTMADLNQRNPRVANYLIQNSIWWIEYAGLDGIRMDTYPYSDNAFMRDWMKRILDEYPRFRVVGESWLNDPGLLSYWPDGSYVSGSYRSLLTNVFDFPLCFAIQKAFTESEGWDSGMARLYDLLSHDFLYPEPGTMVTFADNHDIDRIFSLLKTVDNLKMALAFLFTTRGIPLVWAGTEALVPGMAGDGHGRMRTGMPGGWPDDSVNVFEGKNLSPEQAEMSGFIKRILNWRKTSPAVQTGRLTHYIPEDGIYVYFRILESDKVMVVLNNNPEPKDLDTRRFAENLGSAAAGLEILSGERLTRLDRIAIRGKSAMIIELH